MADNDFAEKFWKEGAIALQKTNNKLEFAIEEFLKNPIGRNKEKLADLIGTNILGDPK